MKRSLTTVLTIAAVLLVAFAGGASAAKLITGKQIKDGTVTGADVKAGSLRGSDVKDGSLKGADVKDGSLGNADLADDSVEVDQLAYSARVFGNDARPTPDESVDTCADLTPRGTARASRYQPRRTRHAPVAGQGQPLQQRRGRQRPPEVRPLRATGSASSTPTSSASRARASPATREVVALQGLVERRHDHRRLRAVHRAVEAQLLAKEVVLTTLKVADGA